MEIATDLESNIAIESELKQYNRKGEKIKRQRSWDRDRVRNRVMDRERKREKMDKERKRCIFRDKKRDIQ